MGFAIQVRVKWWERGGRGDRGRGKRREEGARPREGGARGQAGARDAPEGGRRAGRSGVGRHGKAFHFGLTRNGRPGRCEARRTEGKRFGHALLLPRIPRPAICRRASLPAGSPFATEARLRTWNRWKSLPTKWGDDSSGAGEAAKENQGTRVRAAIANFFELECAFHNAGKILARKEKKRSWQEGRNRYEDQYPVRKCEGVPVLFRRERGGNR
jgi:hypothetical protein